MSLTREELLTQFEYNKEIGMFRRIAVRDCHGNLSKCDYVIEGTNGCYKRVSINGNRYLLHKLVFLYVDGFYPDDEVDHIDGNMLNNKYNNLRYVGKRLNRFNLRKYKNNSTGFSGISIKNGKYYCLVQKDKKRYFRGYFETLEEAVLVRDILYKELDFHENHGN